MTKRESDWCRAVIENRQPLAPTSTDIAPVLSVIEGIRAVVFDVYGTLVVSGSGDVGSADESDKGAKLSEAFQAAKISTSAIPSINEFQSLIRKENKSRVSNDCPKPEVDIVAIWSQFLQLSGTVDVPTQAIMRLASEYESRANPTWPMPGATELLSSLVSLNQRLGIVSNAQVFTPLLVEDLLGKNRKEKTDQNRDSEPKNLADFFDLNLCIFSNRFRQAKPGPRLFEVLVGALKREGITPNEAIYVGNDMLNDVWAAHQAGLKTAWFAGDQRSCRPRVDDPRCRDLRPDLVLTSLLQLKHCLNIQ